MTWIALCDKRATRVDRSGLVENQPGQTPAAETKNGVLATRGTLMFETEVAHFTIPRLLIDATTSNAFRLFCEMTDSGQCGLDMTIGDRNWKHQIQADLTDASQLIRVSYSWDAASRVGVFSIYQPECGFLGQVLVPEPRPIAWRDLEQLFEMNPCRVSGAGLTFMALSDKFEPVGPMPGFLGTTRVETLQGPKPIYALTPQDDIQLKSGEYLKPIKIVKRFLPARGGFLPLRLRANYFGLSDPLDVSASAKLLINGPDVEYLLGAESVVARASHLRDGRSVVPVTAPDVIPYYQVVFETVEVMQGPIGLQSLSLPRAAAGSLQASTTLHVELPDWAKLDHHTLPYRPAHRYEMVTLNASRAA